MNGKKLRLRPRSILLLLVIILTVIGAVFFISNRATGPVSTGRLIPLETKASSARQVTGDGIMSIEGALLRFESFKNQDANWSLQLSGSDYSLTCSSNTVVVYTQNAFQAASLGGYSLFPGPELTEKIIKVVCSDQSIAVLKKDLSGAYSVSVYDLSGQLLDSIALGAYPLDIGYYGANQLWVLTITTSGIYPVSTLTTYNPGVSTTGMLYMEQELITRADITERRFFLSGTTTVCAFDNTGKSLGSIMCYGYSTLAVDTSGENARLLLSQVNRSTAMARLVTLPQAGKETLFRLPANRLGVWFYGDTILVVTTTQLIRLDNSGKTSSILELGGVFDSAQLIGSKLLLTAGEQVYLLNL